MRAILRAGGYPMGLRLLGALAALLALPAQADTTANGSHIANMYCTAYFSPNGGAQQVIISAINGSKTRIRMAAYEITVRAIADALIAAHNRGVDVRIIVDRMEARQTYSQAQYIANGGIDISYDPSVSLHHNKWFTVDGYSLFTGSYNYSANAEYNNAENMLACHTTAGVAAYESYWSQVRVRTIAIPPAL